jgi:hypothetical protein
MEGKKQPFYSLFSLSSIAFRELLIYYPEMGQNSSANKGKKYKPAARHPWKAYPSCGPAKKAPNIPRFYIDEEWDSPDFVELEQLKHFLGIDERKFPND